MARPSSSALARSGNNGSAGESALAVWKLERRKRSRRLLVVGPLALVAALATATWAGSRSGLAEPAPAPVWLLLCVAVGAGGGALLLWPRYDPGRWARGAAGEVATAALLARLPKKHWVVLHDLALSGSRANVDHLVIGPTGVWVVDSKAYRSRLQARWRKVLIGGAPLSTAAVRWEAERVSAVLGTQAQPIVAVHGRGLPRRGRRCNGVRVLPAPQLVRRLSRGRRLWPCLSPRQVRDLGDLAADHFLARAANG